MPLEKLRTRKFGILSYSLAIIATSILLSQIDLYCEVWYKYKSCKEYKYINSLLNQVQTPAGYERISLYKNSYPDWIRHLPVKSESNVIETYEKKVLQHHFYDIYKVIDFPLYFTQDLEQCADWAYRFWYEYQLEVGYGEDLWLHNYNGDKIYYRNWKKNRSNTALLGFFKWTCSYANSYSQKAGLYKVGSEKDLFPGDIIVQNETGGIGHVSIIFDICQNNQGERLYLIGYSFMPAQECHIEKAPNRYGRDCWFTLNGYYEYLDNNFNFGKPVLRSFLDRKYIVYTENPVKAWDVFEKSVRDSKIAIEIAGRQLPDIINGLKTYCEQYEFREQSNLNFPVVNYSLSDVGGENASGYKPDIRYGASPIKGYSFYDGNRHGGHPAHDIFIRDKNQDSIDDNTGEPVFAAAMLDGVVISIYDEWEAESKIRGGNYIWLYHPQKNLISYYAHLKDILVKPGNKVSAGEKLATIGRTGYSAALPRSPTHLHLMVLEYANGSLLPYNFYNDFKR